MTPRGHCRLHGRERKIAAQQLIPTSVVSPRPTGRQVSGARHMLCWSVWELARRANVSTSIIESIERIGGRSSVSIGIVENIRDALIAGGAEFVGTDSVRLRDQP